jgi:PAS domain S-box-containing protein
MPTEMLEVKMVRVDGEVIDVEVAAVPVRFQGRPAAQSVIRDVTERKRAEEALRLGEEKYRTLVEQSLQGFVIVQGTPLRLVFANTAVTDIVGYSVEELVSLEPEQIWGTVHPDDRDIPIQRYEDRMAGQPAPQRYEFRIIRKDGQVRWIETFSMRTEYHGQPAVQAVLIDITERRLAEKGLIESEEKYRSVVEQSADSIFLMDAETRRVLEANPAFRTLLGYTPDEIRALTVYDFLVQPREDIDSRIEKALKEKRNFLGERKYRRKDGSLVDVEVSVAVAVLRGRQVMCVVARDITERKRAEEALRQSEEKYSNLFQHSNDAIFLHDLEGNIIDINQQVLEQFGYGKSEMLALKAHQLHPPEAAERCRWAFDTVGREGIANFETSFVRKNGETFQAEVSSSLFRIGDQTVIQGIVRDVTERKRVEGKLQQLAAFVENNPDVVMTLDESGEVLYQNPAAERVLREMRDTENPHTTFLPAAVRAIIADCLATERGIHDIEVRLGERTWSWTFHPVSSQRIVHCCATDITERCKNQTELTRLSAAVSQSANMIVITDPEGIIEYVNPHFSRSTGYAPSEAIGKPTSILKSGRQDPEFYRGLWETITAGETWSGHLQNRRKNGEIYWERKTITPIFDRDDRIINYLSVGEDITSEITTQQKLVEADKMSAVGMLAAGVAHEFKNYLAGIIGNASFALSELESEGGLELAGDTLSKIVELGERANDVAMSLLSYSKARPDDLAREDLAKVIAKAIKLVEKEMRNLSIEVVTYFEMAPEVEVSTSKIQQLMLNLLINARHAIKSDGVITVALLNAGDHVTVKVGDTGVGIPKNNLRRIFDPFFSTKGVWGKDELVGTGMGLAICRNIAREHGGDLTVESIVGAGTTFTLTLPVHRSQEVRGLHRAPDDPGLKVLFFVLDKSVISHYFRQTCEVNVKALFIDDISKLPDDLSHVADLVICDAKFTGKVELYRMIETCQRMNIPYVMINCGMMEYQLADLYERSAANFKQHPDLSRIISIVKGECAETTS